MGRGSQVVVVRQNQPDSEPGRYSKVNPIFYADFEIWEIISNDAPLISFC